MDSIKRRNPAVKASLLRLVSAILMSVITVASLTGATSSTNTIIINDDNSQTVVYSSQSQPEEILKEENIALGEFDTITFSGIEDKRATITINRSKKVTVTADGKTHEMNVVGKTVGAVLAELGIEVKDEDLINVPMSEEINEDMNVVINRVTYETVEKETEIPFGVETIYTPTLKLNRTRVLSEGVNGVKKTTTLQMKIDGVVSEEKVISEVVTKEPVRTRIFKGNPSMHASKLKPASEIALDANGNPVDYKYKVTGKATAYSSLGRRTKLKQGDVAMDLSKFPRGTKLYIKTPDGSFTYGYSEVSDTGDALVDGRILVDLFFETYKESCYFGAKTVDIYVLG